MPDAPVKTVTDGISPKTHAATVAPLASGLVVSLINFAIAGHFDTVSITALIGGSAGGLIAGAASFLAKAGPLRTIVTDATAAVDAVAKTDPGLVRKVETAIESEAAKLKVLPELHVIEGDVLDPMFADVPESPAGPLLGDGGDPAKVAAPDPRDAQIAALQAQLAAAQASVVTGPPGMIVGQPGGLPQVIS